jgi:hypothetical protein
MLETYIALLRGQGIRVSYLGENYFLLILPSKNIWAASKNELIQFAIAYLED